MAYILAYFLVFSYADNTGQAWMDAAVKATGQPAPQAEVPSPTGALPADAEILRASPFCNSRGLNEAMVSTGYRDAKFSSVKAELNQWGKSIDPAKTQTYKLESTDAKGKPLPPIEIVCSKKVI